MLHKVINRKYLQFEMLGKSRTTTIIQKVSGFFNQKQSRNTQTNLSYEWKPLFQYKKNDNAYALAQNGQTHDCSH